MENISFVNVISDNTKHRLVKLHYENSSGGKGVTIFEYSENGIMNKVKWKLLDESRNSSNFYEYDEDGNLIKKYREVSDGITSTQLYEYDKNENLINEYFQRSDGISSITKYEYDENENLINEYFQRSDGISSITKYEYGENRNLIKANCEGLNGWFYGVINYSNDENGNKLKADIIQKNEKTGTIDYSCNENGNLIGEYWDLSGKWNKTFIYEYGEVINIQ